MDPPRDLRRTTTETTTTTIMADRPRLTDADDRGGQMDTTTMSDADKQEKDALGALFFFLCMIGCCVYKRVYGKWPWAEWCGHQGGEYQGTSSAVVQPGVPSAGPGPPPGTGVVVGISATPVAGVPRGTTPVVAGVGTTGTIPRSHQQRIAPMEIGPEGAARPRDTTSHQGWMLYRVLDEPTLKLLQSHFFLCGVMCPGPHHVGMELVGRTGRCSTGLGRGGWKLCQRVGYNEGQRAMRRGDLSSHARVPVLGIEAAHPNGWRSAVPRSQFV